MARVPPAGADAAARQDYNAFHDLAWRTLQAGPKNDPALMTMLARAQSLSGRPHDALVMLQRLAAMGVATDAATSDDFSGVRALPGWAELEASSAYKKASGLPPPESVTTAPSVTKREPSTAEAPKVETSKPKPATGDAPKVEGSKPEPAKAEPETPKPGAVKADPKAKSKRDQPFDLLRVRSGSGRPRLRRRLGPVHRRGPERPPAAGRRRTVRPSGEPRRGRRGIRRGVGLRDRCGRGRPVGGQQLESVALVDPAQAAVDLGPRADVHSPPDRRGPQPFYRRRGHAAKHPGARRRRTAGVSGRQEGPNPGNGRAPRRVRLLEPCACL